MKDARSIQSEQGWDDDILLDLALEYIENRQDDDAFDAFLRERADLENRLAAEDEAAPDDDVTEWVDAHHPAVRDGRCRYDGDRAADGLPPYRVIDGC